MKATWIDEEFELDAIGEDGEQFPLHHKTSRKAAKAQRKTEKLGTEK